MKTYSKKELEAQAVAVFEKYPNADQVYAREDGNIFFSENLADLGRGKLKIYLIDRNAKDAAKKVAESTVAPKLAVVGATKTNTPAAAAGAKTPKTRGNAIPAEKTTAKTTK